MLWLVGGGVFAIIFPLIHIGRLQTRSLLFSVLFFFVLLIFIILSIYLSCKLYQSSPKKAKKDTNNNNNKKWTNKKWLWTCFQMKDGFSEHNTVRFLLTSVRLIVLAWSASGKYGFSVSSFFVFCLACFASLFFSSNQILFFFVVVVVCSLFIIRSWFINIRSLWLFCQLFLLLLFQNNRVVNQNDIHFWEVMTFTKMERKREKVGKTIRGRKSVREQKRARKRDGKWRKAHDKSRT